MTRSISVSDETPKSSSGLGSRTKSSLTNMSYLLKKPAQNKSKIIITTPDRAVDMTESVYCKTSNATGLGFRSKSGFENMPSLNKPPKSPSGIGEMAIAIRPPVDRKTRKSITIPEVHNCF